MPVQASNPDDDLIRLHHDWDATNVILGVDLADVDVRVVALLVGPTPDEAAAPSEPRMGRPQDDPEVAELMARRCVEQARALGSPCPAHAGLADDGYEPRYRVTFDVEEMRRQHRAYDDPLDIDGPPPEPPPTAEEIRLFTADFNFTGYGFVTRWSIGSGPHPIAATVC